MSNIALARKIAYAAGSVLLAATATVASAQRYYSNQDSDPYRDGRALTADSECWNARAHQFERVRPGEYQDDLDLSRCRAIGDRSYERRDRREWRDGRDAREQCWNPRARQFEDVRSAEHQDDLDFSRCRMTR